jgi:hypothetical protein
VIESALGNMFAYTARQRAMSAAPCPATGASSSRSAAAAPTRRAVRRLLGDTRRIVGQVIQAGATRAKAART